MIPTRKLSETLLEFGSPIIQELSEDSTKEEFEAVLRFVVSAWNVVVLDSWNKTNTYEKKFLKTIESMPTEHKLLAKTLVNRKKNNYATDPRAVANYWVIEKNGDFVFRAAVRLEPRVSDDYGRF